MRERERQKEEVIEETKRFMIQEMARGFSLFEEALLIFEAWDPNVEQCTKVVQPLRMQSCATV